MLKLLQMLNRNVSIVIPLSMAPGLLFKILYDPRTLKALIPAFNFLIVPLIGFGLGRAFSPDQLNLVLVLAAAFIVQTQVASWSTRFVDRVFPLAVSAS